MTTRNDEIEPQPERCYCGDVEPEVGYVCTLRGGHVGDHEAHGPMPEDHFIISWPRPTCSCERCANTGRGLFRFMPLCPDCGNKRCPKGTDHNNTCTRSNEPGQEGSMYS